MAPKDGFRLPQAEKNDVSDYVFAFEELENNLHPALLRRLLKYVERFAVKHGTPIFLTTHSNVALDVFGGSADAQIIHVEHTGRAATTRKVEMHVDRLKVESALGAKPSDILQANGIVWVEGPSDAIHVNRWIELESLGRYREGRDYLCAFYGGGLLARAQFVAPEVAGHDFVNLLQLNPNVVVLCDGDRIAEQANSRLP